jgi:radical SAM-linked protein
MDRNTPADYHYLIRYTKTGMARYLSLHDVRRAWERSTRRASLPLAYSRGFSPKPRLTFGPPLAVGAEGLRECVILSLREELPATLVQERLAATAIAGLSVGPIQPVARRKFTTVWATYDLDLAEPCRDLTKRVAEVLHAESLVIRRLDRDGGQARPRDIRAGVLDLRAAGTDHLMARLSLRDGSIVTPRDLAAAVNVNLKHTVRTEIEIELPN